MCWWVCEVFCIVWFNWRVRLFNFLIFLIVCVVDFLVYYYNICDKMYDVLRIEFLEKGWFVFVCDCLNLLIGKNDM